MSWARVADYTMTEDEVRARLDELAADLLAQWCREQRAAGTPHDVIERIEAIARHEMAAQNARSLPLILRDLQLTAGVASLH